MLNGKGLEMLVIKAIGNVYGYGDVNGDGDGNGDGSGDGSGDGNGNGYDRCHCPALILAGHSPS